MRPPARAVRATSGEDLRLSMMPQRRSIDEESTLPELLGCLQHGGATLPTIDFWWPLDNKSRAAQRGLGTARNGANRVEVRVRAQISIKYGFIRSHGGRPRVRTQLTMMTPQGMRVVAFRPDHRSRPIRAHRRSACSATSFEMWRQISLPANRRIGIAPSGHCVCHAHRRPVVRSHRGCGDSPDGRSGRPIGLGRRCRQPGRPIGSRLHCRDIVPQRRVVLPFRSKGRDREPQG